MNNYKNIPKVILSILLVLSILTNTATIFAIENNSNSPPAAINDTAEVNKTDDDKTTYNDPVSDDASNKDENSMITDQYNDKKALENDSSSKEDHNDEALVDNKKEENDSSTNVVENDQEIIFEENVNLAEDSNISSNSIIDPSSLKLISTLNESSEYLNINLQNYMNDSQRVIWFAIWSADSGQDDLTWVVAKRNDDGSYSYQESLAKHNSLGLYHIHAYDSYNGNLNYVSASTVQVNKPEGYLNVTDHRNGSFKVEFTITNHAQMIKDAPIAVWSRDDKADLLWYYPTKSDDSHYAIEINIDNHMGNIGKYRFAGYVTTTSNVFTSIAYFETIIGIDEEKSDLTSYLDSTSSNININLSNYFSYKHRIIWFAIWSEDGGQDDLAWVIAKRNPDGSYSCQESLAKHNSLGVYHIHAYDSYNGSLNYVSASTVQVNKPEGYLNVTDHKNGSFKVKFTITNHVQMIKDAPIAVWSRDDKADLLWYYPTKSDDSHYAIEINIDNHMGNIGKYRFAGYVTTTSNVFVGISYLEKDIGLQLGELQVKVNNEETQATISLNSQSLGGNGNKLFFAIWSLTNGQDDLIWYSANKNSNGYSCDVSINNHKTLGTYRVDAYIQNKSGNLVFFNRTEFTINKLPIATSSINNSNALKGAFDIFINVNSSTNIDKLQIAVWKDSNQGDLMWYTASKVDDHTYKITVDIQNHKFHYGKFTYHIYATLTNGIFTNIATNNYDFIVTDYLSIYRVESGHYRAAIVNPSSSKIDNVQIATWSNVNGQDDVVWYNASKQDNNTWYADIYTSQHKNSGTFTAHVYGKINGSLSFINSTSYYIPQSDFLSGIDLKAQYYSSNTNYLILASLSDHKVNVYQGSYMNWKRIKEYQSTVGAPSTPTVTGDFKIYRKGRYFDSGSSRCFYYSAFYVGYYFHSVLYYKDNEPLRLQDGRLGMNLSHGCIRLDVNNAKWIYDNCPIGTRVIVY